MATLQELDTWGNLEALDTYGNLEFLDGVGIRLASAAVSTSSTAIAASSVTFKVTGNVTGAASVSAIAAFIARYSASPALAATSTASFTRDRGMNAVAPLEASANGEYKVIFLVDGSANIVATTQSGNSVTYVLEASSSLEFSATMVSEILGEKWTDTDEDGETWTIEVIGSEVWTDATDGTETWNIQ